MLLDYFKMNRTLWASIVLVTLAVGFMIGGILLIVQSKAIIKRAVGKVKTLVFDTSYLQSLFVC